MLVHELDFRIFASSVLDVSFTRCFLQFDSQHLVNVRLRNCSHILNFNRKKKWTKLIITQRENRVCSQNDEHSIQQKYIVKKVYEWEQPQIFWFVWLFEHLLEILNDYLFHRLKCMHHIVQHKIFAHTLPAFPCPFWYFRFRLFIFPFSTTKRDRLHCVELK